MPLLYLNSEKEGENMLVMSESSREFLEQNCPKVLEVTSRSDALDILYEDIDRKGFGGEHFDEYNDYGRAAQKVYDDLIRLNPKS